MVQIKQLRPSEYSEDRKQAMKELGKSIDKLEQTFKEEISKMETKEIEQVSEEVLALMKPKNMTAREQRKALNIAYMKLRDLAMIEKEAGQASVAAVKEKEKEIKEDKKPKKATVKKEKATTKKEKTDIKKAKKTKTEEEADDIIDSVEDTPEDSDELFD